MKTPRERALEIVPYDDHPLGEFVWQTTLRAQIEEAIAEAVAEERAECASLEHPQKSEDEWDRLEEDFVYKNGGYVDAFWAGWYTYQFAVCARGKLEAD